MRRETLEAPLQIWRIVSRRRAASAWDGEGAGRYGGRWNHPGARLVYASTTLSLAALEVFVHADPDTAPQDLVAIRAELPAGTQAVRIPADEGAPGWRDYRAAPALRNLGTNWLKWAESVACLVPSAIVPQEWNVLLAPAHPDFSKLQVEAPIPFGFDPRMWKRATAP